MSQRPDFSFLQHPPLEKVLRALSEGHSRIVGGAVRDALASRKVGDIDLATTLMPERVMELAVGAGLKAVPTGLAHGTVTLVADHEGFEVTTLRRDVVTDGRHAEVEFTDNWEADAARRDFTMNAMSLDAAGQLYDYFGGAADLAAGCVRFVGKAEQRIAEDYLRLLRFFRLHAHFGQGAPEAQGLAACRDAVPHLPQLSRERIRTELLKLLAAPNPLPSWGELASMQAFAVLGLPLAATSKLTQLIELENKYDRVDPLRRLAAALEGVPPPADLASGLRLSSKEAMRLAAMLPPREVENAPHFAYWHGLEAARDNLLLTGNVAPLAQLNNWQKPRFPITGADLLKEGGVPSPRLGQALREVERWWVAQNFTPSREESMVKAKKMLAE
jgi:poly(A) polymerase